MVKVNRTISSIAAALFAPFSLAVGDSLSNNTDLDAAGDSAADITEESSSSRRGPHVEIITELHSNYAGANYIRSLIEAEKLDSNSAFMMELPIAFNGILEAFYNDKISENQLTRIIRGFGSENTADTASNTVKTIAELKKTGIPTFAYASRLVAVADGNTNDFIVNALGDNYEEAKNTYDDVIQGLEDLQKTKQELGTVTSAEVQEILDRGSFVGRGPSGNDSISLSDLESLKQGFVNQRSTRLANITEALVSFGMFGEQSKLGNELDAFVKDQVLNEGVTLIDSINAYNVVSIIIEHGLPGPIKILAGEAHVNGPLLTKGKNALLAEGVFDEYLKRFGVENLEITSVRDTLEAFEAKKVDIEFMPNCPSETLPFTRYAVINPETEKQTFYDSRGKLIDAYKGVTGRNVGKRFADYCNPEALQP